MSKGQLISKCLFGVFNFLQETNENKSHSSKIEFIRSFFGGNVGLKKSFRFCLTFKIDRIFPKKFFCEEYLIRGPTYINDFFWFLKYFTYILKMCPMFVSSVHDFGKSEDDII